MILFPFSRRMERSKNRLRKKNPRVGEYDFYNPYLKSSSFRRVLDERSRKEDLTQGSFGPMELSGDRSTKERGSWYSDDF